MSSSNRQQSLSNVHSGVVTQDDWVFLNHNFIKENLLANAAVETLIFRLEDGARGRQFGCHDVFNAAEGL